MDRYLVLEDGTVYKGTAFGGNGDVIAEIVFTTAMTGYIETLTDKSYTGQAVVQTFPLIGNYGVITSDAESAVTGPSAYILREICDGPSNFRCEGTLNAWLKERGVPGICGIDTRALTRKIREHGVMNGMITDDPQKADISKIRAYRVVRPVDKVSAVRPFIIRSDVPDCGGPKLRVGLIDLGLKQNIARCLARRGCEVTVLPYNTDAAQIIQAGFNGIVLSNGPGDPQDNTELTEQIKQIAESRIPLMGICLGHQLLALACGFDTMKLKYGHRGANQPVKCLENNVTYISSQNHGYAVVNESIDPDVAEPLFVNVNDGTNEGLKYRNIPAFSVQFHPEACAGPKDTEFLFDRFVKMMEGSAPGHPADPAGYKTMV